MASLCRIDVNQTGLLRCPISLRCGNIEADLKGLQLLDTGAGMCHMSYFLWCQLGLHKLCFDDKKELFESMGITKPEEMTFESLPFKPKTSVLGDDRVATVYEFMLDELALGVQSIGHPPITFNNITVKIINSDKYSFIVGWNVLRYLKVEHDPSIKDSICRLALESDGKLLLEEHRKRGVNSLQNTFDYIER